MSDLAYGIHAVDVLLRRSPERIISLSVQSDRNDKRIQGLLALAQNQGVGVDRVSKADLDAAVAERHQGVVAIIKPRQGTAALTERDLTDFLASVSCPLVLVLQRLVDVSVPPCFFHKLEVFSTYHTKIDIHVFIRFPTYRSNL